jgi:Tol biopolymer transport system component
MKPRMKLVTFLSVVAVLSLLTFAFAQKGGKGGGKPPQPPPPPSDPAIAYVEPGNSQDRWDLMVMDADGTNQRVVLGQRFTQSSDPDWSPDGKQLVFSKDDTRGVDDGLFVVNVDGSGLKKIRNSGSRPAWSPVELAGRYRIAFTDRARLEDGTLKGDNDIFLVDLEGNNLTQLTDAGVGEWEVSWSPSGDQIAVHIFDDVNNRSDIVLYRVDCNDTACGAQELGSVIFPDSPLAGYNDIIEADWARSHNILVVGAQLVPRGSFHLWTINFDTGEYKQLTDNPEKGAHDISWLPDDSGLVFVQGPDDGLWVMDYDPNTGDASDVRLIVTPQQAGTPFFWTPRWRRNK